MLPNETVMCHRTAFAVSCFDGVTKHKCRLWCHVSGTDAMGRDIDVYGCGDELSIKLLHEVAKEVRQSSASMDKVANEVKETRDMASVRDVLLINAVKANGDDRRFMLSCAEDVIDGGVLRLASENTNPGEDCASIAEKSSQ